MNNALIFWNNNKYRILYLLKKYEPELVSPPYIAMKPASILRRELGIKLNFAAQVLQLAKEQGNFSYIVDDGDRLWEYSVSGDKCELPLAA